MECVIKDTSVYYETRGEGRPIVMLHGLADSHLLMASYLEPSFEQRDGWKRIYLDLPGMGNTQGPDWISNSDQMLEAVLDFIEAVIPQQPFTLAGYSYGAYLARGVVCRKFNLVEGLMLICPVVIADHSKRSRPAHKTLVKDAVFVASLEPRLQEVFDSIAVVQNQRVWDRSQVRIEAEKLADGDFISRLQANSGYPFSFDPDAIASPLEKPTLIVTGRQDAVVGYQDAWRILENYPRATFAVLDLAGHNLPAEQERVFTALASEWLDRIEERN